MIRTHVLPIGSYYISNSDRLQVDTVFRKFSMTCRQLVTKFGKENVSDAVASAWITVRLKRGSKSCMPYCRTPTVTPES